MGTVVFLILQFLCTRISTAKYVSAITEHAFSTLTTFIAIFSRPCACCFTFGTAYDMQTELHKRKICTFVQTDRQTDRQC